MPSILTSLPQAAARPVSGNPGYLPGAPLLVGQPVTSGTKSAIARLVSGLPHLTSSATGACTPAARGTPVAYAATGTSACALLLSRAELQAFCQSRALPAGGSVDSGAAAATTLVDVFLGGVLNAPLVVGVWGNSSAVNAAQWLPLVVGPVGTL